MIYQLHGNSLAFVQGKKYANLRNCNNTVVSKVGISRHYENTPILYTAIFHGCKEEYFPMKKGVFLIFAQTIDCGYTLEPPQCGGSNVYPQSMF